MRTDLLIFLFIFGSTILNIVVPTPGSSTVTPVFAIWIGDPLHALALASAFFFMSGVVRTILFREFILKKYVREFLGLSMLFSIIGALALLPISPYVLYALLFVVVLWSLVAVLLKTFLNYELPQPNKWGSAAIAMLSGFLQGTGLSGSAMRGSFFYAEGLSLQEVQGTSSLIGTANFGVATLARISTHQFTLHDLWLLLALLPLVVLGTWLGKKIIVHITKRVQNAVIIVILAVILVSVGGELI